VATFTKDVRLDTFAIGLSNACAWYVAYPAFLGFVASASLFADAATTPYLVFFSFFALQFFLMFAALSLLPVAFSSIVTYSVAFVVRNAYRYRLQDRSWRTVLNLAGVYSAISIAVFAMGVGLWPPKLHGEEFELHQWLWPAGVMLLNVLVSTISAAITYRLLRPEPSV